MVGLPSPTFFDIRNKILAWEGLSLPTRTLWISLCQYAWADGSCYPSTQTLAKKLNVCLRAIKQSKAELIDKKLISVFHRVLPATDLIYPFIRFKNIEQRSSNILVLHGAPHALCVINNIEGLQTDSALNAPDQCTTCTIDSAPHAPIKEKYLKETLKEEKIHIVQPPSKSPEQKKTKKQESEENKAARIADRQRQLIEIESNFPKYHLDFPEINLDLLLRKMKRWLEGPRGKTRKQMEDVWQTFLGNAQSTIDIAKLTYNNRKNPHKDDSLESFTEEVRRESQKIKQINERFTK